MNSRNRESDKNKKTVLDSLSQNEKDKLERIWEESGDYRRERKIVTEQETEDALASVRSRLGLQVTEKNSFSAIDDPHLAENSALPDLTGSHKRNRPGRTSILGFTLLLTAAAAVLIFFFLPATPAYTEIIAPHGEVISYVLPDGSEIELNSGTTLRFRSDFPEDQRAVYLNGEAWFSVNSDPSNIFTVSTHRAVVEVTGTKFNLRSWSGEGESRLHLTEGEVRFFEISNRTEAVTLKPGQASVLRASELRPAPPTSENHTYAVAWREKRLAFNNQSLESIFRELERRYDTVIVLENHVFRNETLSTFYSREVPLEDVLNDICTVKGLQFSKTSEGYRIF